MTLITLSPRRKTPGSVNGFHVCIYVCMYVHVYVYPLHTSTGKDAPPTPVIIKACQKKPYLGMVSWQLSDLPKLVDTLITGATLDELRRGIPCQIAHVLFMCLRYADHCHDDQQTSQLIEGVSTSLQQLTQVGGWVWSTTHSLIIHQSSSSMDSVTMTTQICCLSG